MEHKNKKNIKIKQCSLFQSSKAKTRLKESLKKAIDKYNGSLDCLNELDKISEKIIQIDLQKNITKPDRFREYLDSNRNNTESVINTSHIHKNKKTSSSIAKAIKNEQAIDHTPQLNNKGNPFSDFINVKEKCDNEEDEQIVEDRIEEIKSILKSSSVLLVQGNTGCGKTTKIPKYLMDDYPNIVCTQPRRLAAINVARKVALDSKCVLGTTIGYSIRFEDKTSKDTKLRFVTDGILVNEITYKKGNSSKIAGYDLIIIDEAHERSINVDFLLGYIKKRMQEDQVKTKLLIMSATINSKRFAEYFNCPIITIKHKIFPLEFFYLKEDDEDYLSACITTTVKIVEREKTGDILVFLTGQDEIEKAHAYLSTVFTTQNISVLKLFSNMSPEEQDLIFQKNNRKVVLCTNIAETSITVENVKFVVDSGKFKCKKHSSKSAIDLLEVLTVSVAQAKQRAGRAGRTGSGVVYRIYTHSTFLSMEENPLPEILRSRISSIILSMKSIGIDDVVNFDYIDKPDTVAIDQAQRFLYYIKAIDGGGHITKLGKEIARMPLSPEMAMCVYVANNIGCLNAVATIIAFLNFQSPFLDIKNDNPYFERFKKAVEKFSHPKGNFFSFLLIFKAWEKTNFSFIFLKSNFFCVNVMKQIKNIRSQILKPFGAYKDSSIRIEESFCSGFFMNVAKIDDKWYRTMFGNSKCYIHQKDMLFKTRPKYLIFFELFLGHKLYIRHCIEINPYVLSHCVNYGVKIHNHKN